MKKKSAILVPLILSIPFLYCANQTSHKKSENQSNQIQRSDSNIFTKTNPINDNLLIKDKLQDTSSINIIIREYEKIYQDTFKIDTQFFSNNKKIEVEFNHYCLYDSAVTIPLKYVSYLGINEFITHNFESKFILKSNGVGIIDTTINKEFFRNSDIINLNEYGVLLYPNFSILNDQVSIDYSLSIPLTDVGTRVSVNCDIHKNFKINIY